MWLLWNWKIKPSGGDAFIFLEKKRGGRSQTKCLAQKQLQGHIKRQRFNRNICGAAQVAAQKQNKLVVLLCMSTKRGYWECAASWRPSHCVSTRSAIHPPILGSFQPSDDSYILCSTSSSTSVHLSDRQFIIRPSVHPQQIQTSAQKLTDTGKRTQNVCFPSCEDSRLYDFC